MNLKNTGADPDFVLIDEIVNGDKEKYELLMRKYNQRLYRIAKGILWRDDETEDAMQEAYINAFQKLSTFKKQSAFGTWMTRILINECLIRKRNKKVLSQVVNADDQTKKIPEMADPFNPENKMINNELKLLLENAIASLPDKYRTVFVMREIENMNVADTKEALNISETNVKVILSRAKEMLRTNLLSGYPLTELLDFNLVRCDRIVKNVLGRIC